MNRRTFMTTLAGAGASLMIPASAEAAAWLQLGSRKVNGLVDVDRINVGASFGRFRRIRLKVRGTPLFIARIVVEFGNGGEQVIRFNQLFLPGQSTGSLDLAGEKRFIQHVTFVYGKLPLGQGATYVDLQGRR